MLIVVVQFVGDHPRHLKPPFLFLSLLMAESSSKRHHVDQNTDKWLELRAKCVLTASEAPCLCGSGIGYESHIELWDRKVSGRSEREVSSFAKEAMDRGKALEKHGLSALDMRTGKKHIPGAFFTRTLVLENMGSFLLGASPDGEYEDGTVLEIKCPLNSTDIAPLHEDMNKRKKFWRYWVQVQFQLWVMERREAILFLYSPEVECKAWAIQFLPDFWEEYFIPRLISHLALLETKIRPKPLPRGHLDELWSWGARVEGRKRKAASPPSGRPSPCPLSPSPSNSPDNTQETTPQ